MSTEAIELPELYQGRVLQVPLEWLKPSPENEQLYRPVVRTDPAIIALANSMRHEGVLDTLVATRDGYILSGHRRHTAAQVAGLETVPCRFEPFNRTDDPDRFLVLLREYNRQRDKTLDEKLREEVVTTDPNESARALYAYRRERAEVKVSKITIRGEKTRCEITSAKAPFLAAIQRIIVAHKKHWPLSDRRIHYYLLNNPPLKHASKASSKYANDKPSYNALKDILTRARLDGSIPFEAIADETRPVSLWDVHDDPRSFMREELDGMMRGYWRNLMQSQANHFEILGEKNTNTPILRPVAGEYTIPLTTGRGYCSLPPRHAMAQRFKNSGKEKLVLLIVSDFDPEGEDIAHSFARSMRDDFDIEHVHAIKVALTFKQVKKFKLPPNMTAKEKSSRSGDFVKKYGKNVYELEALQPEAIQKLLRQAIESVIDRDAYQAEIEAERRDAAFLDQARQRAMLALRGLEGEIE